MKLGIKEKLTSELKMSFQIFLSHFNGGSKFEIRVQGKTNFRIRNGFSNILKPFQWGSKFEIRNQVETNFIIKDEKANIKLDRAMLKNDAKRSVKSNNSRVKQKEGCMMI